MGVVERLVAEKLFVPTWIANDILFEEDREALLIEHESIEPNIMCKHWTFGMYDEAKKLVIKLNNVLLEYGYELSDPHYENIIFRGCQPIYIDFGSIQPQEEMGLDAYNYFEHYWVWPFKLLKSNVIDSDISSFLIKYFYGITSKQYYHTRYPLFGFGRLFQKCKNLIEKISFLIMFETKSTRMKTIFFSRTLKKIFHVTSSKVCKIKKRKYSKWEKSFCDKKISQGRWSNYQLNFVTTDGSVLTDERFDFYMKMFKRLNAEGQIKNILEIAENSGAFSQLLLEYDLIDFAVVTDYDIGAVEAGFQRCRNKDDISSKISFAVVDVTREELEKTYCADIVFALAITHHLLITQKISLSYVIAILSQYTSKYVVVEFMPLGIWSGDSNCQPIPEWYNLEWFLNGLKKRFTVLEVTQISSNRIAILGELKIQSGG